MVARVRYSVVGHSNQVRAGNFGVLMPPFPISS
jgi:hypothetical protein